MAFGVCAPTDAGGGPGGGAAAVLRAAPAKPAHPPAWAGGRAGALCAPAAAPRTAPACREAIASGGARKWDCLWRAADCKGKRRVAMAWPAFWGMRPHRRRWRPGGGAAAVLRAAPAKPARPPAWAGGRAGALCAPAAAPPHGSGDRGELSCAHKKGRQGASKGIKHRNDSGSEKRITRCEDLGSCRKR